MVQFERQFIPPLFDAVEVSGEISVLDLDCGPGYVSVAAARGANARSLDSFKKMIGLAQGMEKEEEREQRAA